MDVSIRLRRAIVLNDMLLVRRIVKNNPLATRNPDYADKSNTSLHLAAKLGCLEIARFLIEAGHEDEGIALNTEFETPLMIACEAKQVEVGQLLVAAFPRCVPWANKAGMDALMLSSRNGTLPLLPLLLTSNPAASPTAHDKDGNTALHYASASGELKALRLLLQFGASPLAQNAYSWTPVAYSATTAAEAYFKQLVAEVERRRADAAKAERDKDLARMAGMRLVTGADENEGGGGGAGAAGSSRNSPAQRAGSAMGLRGRLDSFGVSDQPMRLELDWSPVATPGERMAMTPTEEKTRWPFSGGQSSSSRRRAGSGD